MSARRRARARGAADGAQAARVRGGFRLLQVVLVATVAAVGAPLASPALGQEPPSVVPLVRLPFPREDGSLTPYTFELGYSLMTLVYDTLLWRDAEGNPQPWLARSVETSPDGRQVTLKLAEGVKWHDGVSLTAADVAFTFDFVARHPHPQFTPQLRAVDRATAADPSTVVITLRQPTPGFLDQPLADLPILPAHLWRDLRRDQLAPPGLPVGSGPYRVVDHRPGEAYRFEANDSYFRGPPAVRTLEVPIITSAEKTLEAFGRREVDVIPVSLPSDAAARAERDGARLLKGPLYLSTVLHFNLRQPPFDRAEARRAVSRALDLGRIADIVGDSVAADRGLLHPASPWSSPTPVHVFDEAAARSALAPLQLPLLTILVPENDPVKVEAGRQVALALVRAGVRAEPASLPPGGVEKALGGADGTPPFAMAIGVEPPLLSYDPSSLGSLSSSGADGGQRSPGYRSAQFDELATRVATTTDRAARQQAVQQAQELIATEAPVVPLFFAKGAFGVRPSAYDGWVFIKGTGILDKRSFEARAPQSASPSPPAVVVEEAPAERRSPVGVGALGALGAVVVAAVLAAIGLLGRRRR